MIFLYQAVMVVCVVSLPTNPEAPIDNVFVLGVAHIQQGMHLLLCMPIYRCACCVQMSVLHLQRPFNVCVFLCMCVCACVCMSVRVHTQSINLVSRWMQVYSICIVTSIVPTSDDSSPCTDLELHDTLQPLQWPGYC